ncbi:MAG: type II toxin-antitoxin system HicA family toxin [Pseudomonadota bacterium]
MNSKQRKTLVAIFEKPTRGDIVWQEIEKLVIALGGEIIEGNGSRVRLVLQGHRGYFHRPHPGKEARKYAIEAAREFLVNAGVKP